METIKTTIIKYIESQGKASKSKVEAEVGYLTQSTGDCIARRMRELVAEGVLKKTQREYEGKKYFEYSVVEEKCNHEFELNMMSLYQCKKCGDFPGQGISEILTKVIEQAELNL